MSTPIRAAVVTVSDRAAGGEREDESGAVLAELLRELADRADVNLVVTTGGTGLSPRDNTPEATRSVIEREVPGLAEAMRAETYGQTPTAMLSRAVCGTRSGALVVNLPGSPKGVRQCFAVIRPVLPHAVALLAGRPHEEAPPAGRR